MAVACCYREPALLLSSWLCPWRHTSLPLRQTLRGRPDFQRRRACARLSPSGRHCGVGLPSGGDVPSQRCWAGRRVRRRTSLRRAAAAAAWGRAPSPAADTATARVQAAAPPATADLRRRVQPPPAAALGPWRGPARWSRSSWPSMRRPTNPVNSRVTASLALVRAISSSFLMLARFNLGVSFLCLACHPSVTAHNWVHTYVRGSDLSVTDFCKNLCRTFGRTGFSPGLYFPTESW